LLWAAAALLLGAFDALLIWDSVIEQPDSIAAEPSKMARRRAKGENWRGID
jgi:hypothetical protein